MRLLQLLAHRLIPLIPCLLGCAASVEDAGGSYPIRPVKIVVPFAAGGGSDTFTRLVQRAVEKHDLFPQPLVVINVPGAGGSVGSRRVKNARPDGYTMLLWHDGILTNHHSGQSPYGPEAFDKIAGTGEVGLVIAVRDDSRFSSLSALMRETAARPNEVVFAANIGAPVHFAGMMLEQAEEGARFRYVQTGDGAKRFGALVGNHADVSAFSVAEYLQFKEGGIRALAVCARDRNPAIDVPTAIEQGYDVISSTMQFWFAPRGTPPERIARFQNMLREVMALPEFQAQLQKLSVDPVFLEGEAFATELADRNRRVTSVASRPIANLPDYPLIVGLLVTGFGTIVLGQTVRERRQTESLIRGSDSGGGRKLIIVASITLIYVACLQWEVATYRPLTLVFVLLVGFALAPRERSLRPAIVILSLVLSWGLHWVMTNLFVIDLP